ncbi:MAG: hypothetical protein A2365_01580 [Candidatus Nealsonbacteria bacterium RIFOXYB1_FULL_40_15]|uniref:Uncharacterized protein n=2 Tax=Candidatus Nealsoniibacteriota TaxID=1817911 RepID=A0A1G2ENY2_9BACT|nr:MAG: hypothetical protein A2427_00120 [Candidatus Nealsonbacteria bacterium RIFOXYC1_FULL_40_7]OGZ27263.1 MAG: hypothetical protein A2365_01580 [Candidatus Nealsonbacteria bacterium RIFOXYB1_FULL_40_15]OGZ29954.1 MAG: hypothetical protein A2562_02805 [Candidatus Nealsonbacteria bacterium RIFOXYD1_FULL_39_11]
MFNEAKEAIKEKMATLMLAGFGLVAALAWNDAVQSLFNAYFPQGQEVLGKFTYAFLVTIVVVIISIQLQKIVKRK